MKVKELIEKLKSIENKDADVVHLWDGATRTDIQIVYLSKDGDCVTSDFEETAYSDGDRPLNAPLAKDDPYWETEAETVK